MSKLKISLSCCDYDRTRAIFEGRVGIEGCEVNAQAMAPEESFHRAFKFQEFDVAELSMSTFMSLTADGKSDFIGIPAFLSRMFRHSSLYIRTDRGINQPADLKGRVIGVPEYQMTAALWVRGMLSDDFGVAPADISWRCGGLFEPGGGLRAKVTLPADVEVLRISDDQTLSGLLDEGAIDGLLSAREPSCFPANPDVARLFPDYRPVEEDYYRRTGMFPIMHLVGIRRSLVEANPWLPVNVFVAFIEAKRICYRNLEKIGHLFTTLPWPVEDLARARELMGEDHWPYGVAENKTEIEAMLRYAHDQGLTARQLTPQDLFAPSVFDLVKI